MPSGWSQLTQFGLAYLISGVACVLYGLVDRRVRRSIELGLMLLVMASFNLYIENYGNMHGRTFIGMSVLLVLGFVGIYSHWIIALINQVIAAPRRYLFSLTFLPIVWFLSISLILVAPGFARWENPPLALYMFVTFICVLHVPCFLVAKGKAQGSILKRTAELPKTTSLFIRSALIGFVAPALFILFVQLTARDDWRLFSLDIALSFTNMSLVIIAGTANLSAT
jgi:hypothetical protein